MPDCAGNLTLLLESDLLQAGWDRNAVPDDHREYLQFAMDQQRNSLLKKYIGSIADESKCEKAALELFLQDNEDCSKWSFTPCSVEVEWVVSEAQAIIDRFFHPTTSEGPLTGCRLTLNTLLQGIDFGKGANIGISNVDFYSKLTSEVRTTTSIGLVKILDHAFPTNDRWRAVFKSTGATSVQVVTVSGNALCFASKNAVIARAIASEPTWNMLLQKGIENVLNQGNREIFGIDLTIQPDKNRALARLGSIDGSFCTIDLKSASNRNATNMVRKMFAYAPEAFRWLELTRSPCTILPNGEVVNLHMLSSMGNAFTFPLQTMIFACVVVASYKVLGIKPKHPKGDTIGNYGVFGDDIICVPEAYNLVCRTLESLGHIVNHDKSFNTGRFRESCGSDWYSGHNVRGVYIKNLSDRCDIYSAINRLNLWSSRHGVPLVNTISYLLSLLSDKDRKILVPMHEAPDAGIHVPEDFVTPGDWCPTYGRAYRAVVANPYQVDLRSESSLVSQILRARKTVLKMRKIRGGKRLNAKVKYLALKGARYDPNVHLLSVLAGKLRRGRFVIRDFGRRTMVKQRRSSCWNYVPADRLVRDGGEDLHLLTRVNLVDLTRI